MAKIKTQEELRKSYEDLWQTAVLKEDLDYYGWILSLLEVKTGQHLLDIGCGAGFLLAEAENRGLKTWGIDISQNALNQAHKICKQTQFSQGVAEELPYSDEEFNFVTCLGSLEHFLDPDRALKEMHRVLRYDGTVCIVLPNRWFIVDFIRGVLNGEGLSHQQENERFYSLKEALQLINEASFAVVRKEKHNPSVETIRTSKPLAKHRNLFLWLYKRAKRRLPLSASYCFVFKCKKIEAAAPSLLQVGRPENEQFLAEGWYSAEKGPPKFRWTQKQSAAYLRPKDSSSAICLRVWANHPDLETHPLTLKVAFNREIVGEISINESRWKEVCFAYDFPDKRGGKVGIQVDRTWNPALSKVSADNRHLGVAIEKIWAGEAR